MRSTRGMLFAFVGILATVFVNPSSAETCFTATIDGTQAGTGSGGTGTGYFVLNDAETELSYNITFSGLGSAETAAHIHNENEANGVVKDLGTGDPKIGTWDGGDVPPLTAGRVADLLAGKMYVNIHSTSFPGGEIRGQILVTPCNEICFDAIVDSVDAGTGSLGTGIAKLSLNHLQTELKYKIEFSGLGSIESAAHIHNSNEGGAVVKDLGTGTPKIGSWTTSDTPPLTPARVSDLLSGAMYVNIHSLDFPGGEIRGSILQTAPCGSCYTALIDGVQAGTGSVGAGFAYTFLNHVEDELLYQITFIGLGSLETAAHLHNANEGNAVVKDIGVGMSKAGIWDGGDTPPLTPARVVDLKAGSLYVNIHSLDFPGGEIRGRLLAGSCVPVNAPQHPAFASSLSQNYPNPFNPSTTIGFTLAERGRVRLDVFDVSGRHVASLISGVRGAGDWTAKWEGQDREGNAVASGVYFYRLVVGPFTETRKMILLK